MVIHETHESPTLWTSVVRYGVAVLVVFLAGGITLVLPPVATGTPFLFFFAAVMLSAWYGGFGPALVTLLLSAVWSAYFILPVQPLREADPHADLMRVSLFVVVAFLISALYTRQQRTTVAERLQREYWQTTLASIGDGVIVSDALGNVTTMNPVAQRLTGWSLDAAQGNALADVFVIVNEETRQPVEDPVRKVLRTGVVAGLANHTVLRPKQGTEIPIDDSAAPIRDAAGRLQGMVLVFRDITARRQAEEASLQRTAELQVAKEQAEAANRSKSEFLANMSHELRTPLNAIIGFTGTLLMKLPGPLTVDQDKQLRTVQGSAKHLLSLINDILDMAKIEASKMELIRAPVVLQDVLHEVASALRPLAEAKGLTFAVQMPDVALVTQTDRRALSQILLNLTNNAIKFTEQGQVGLELRQHQADGQVRTEIRVRDTGIGIRPEEQAKLFHAFTQVDASTKRRYEGTGLGLHLSQRLAELLGKQITFESEYGKGSTFTVGWNEE